MKGVGDRFQAHATLVEYLGCMVTFDYDNVWRKTFREVYWAMPGPFRWEHLRMEWVEDLNETG